jgi:hypothetical protein
MSGATHVLLAATLELAVPLCIADLRAAGGPREEDRERARRFADELASHGDELLYRSREKGGSAALFAELARALAVLAWQPGGVRFAGLRWEVTEEGHTSCLA